MEKRQSKINPALFELNGKPGFMAAFPQAMQHILAMLVGNITPPILIAQAVGLPEQEKILLTQAAMLIGGITTLLQLFPVLGFGMGLPSVMGVAFAYMPILLSIGVNFGIGAIFGAQLIAAFASIFIGVFIGKLRKFFPPVVSGTVVLSIGLSLYGTAINYMGGGAGAGDSFGQPKFWIIAMVVLIVTLACNFFGKGYIKVSGMLIGMVVGCILAFFMGNIISFDNIKSAQWFALPKILHWKLEFYPAAIISMILMYVVQAVQTIGDVSSTAMGAFGREATNDEIGGAIKGQGICGMLGSLIGGLPTDPFSQNVGIIVTTKVISKVVFSIVGVILILAGLVPKFGAIMTSVPYSVLGGATITVFAAITMSGIQLINEQPMNYRNRMIVGISLALGVGISTVSSSLQYFPQIIRDIFGSSPIVGSFLISFLLNIIVPVDDTVEEEAIAPVEKII